MPTNKGFDVTEEFGGKQVPLFADADIPRKRPGLADRFIVPPFSVLDARQGYWLTRKRAWLAMGIQSELGRDATCLPKTFTESNNYRGFKMMTATSVFDPVLCEIAYRWFSPEGSVILDPFAGGSVRGVVAAALGRNYIGIDLSERQIEANREQALAIFGDGKTAARAAVLDDPQLRGGYTDNPGDLTPVDEHGGYRVKRDDTYVVAGVRGGKARTCYTLAKGAEGLITAGSRQSPQVNIVAHIAAHCGVPCRVHVPAGELTPELEDARAQGAELVMHRPGYNSVICARAREDAAASGWKYIPFGMECIEAVQATAGQVANIPSDTKRLVVPVGSGMSLAGVLQGLLDLGRRIPVLGVRVGADPSKRLNAFAPFGWQGSVELVTSPLDYHAHAPETMLGELELDPVYEAKCLPYLEEGDLLWVVGIRPTCGIAKPDVVMHEDGGTTGSVRWITGNSLDMDDLVDEPVDFIFTCPPYYDLEVYSDDPRDLSNVATYDDFLASMGDIVGLAAARLKPDRFSMMVVGNIRDKGGHYRDLVGDTVRLFAAAGMHYYNEAVLITPTGTLPVRAARGFEVSRKLGKGHQNVLVFVKGDARRAADGCEKLGDITNMLAAMTRGTEEEEGEER